MRATSPDLKRKPAVRMNAQAAVRHERVERTLRALAKRLAPGDLALADDLYQHGMVSILKRSGINTVAYWLSLARWRMQDLRRKEALRARHAELTPSGEVVEAEEPQVPYAR
ncbi:MAG: hypothetical protein M5U26_08360 [Planctomycetota bacterium]|nr:hypothetical protein [Planctomycetota bacterium]